MPPRIASAPPPIAQVGVLATQVVEEARARASVRGAFGDRLPGAGPPSAAAGASAPSVVPRPGWSRASRLRRFGLGRLDLRRLDLRAGGTPPARARGCLGLRRLGLGRLRRRRSAPRRRRRRRGGALPFAASACAWTCAIGCSSAARLLQVRDRLLERVDAHLRFAQLLVARHASSVAAPPLAAAASRDTRSWSLPGRRGRRASPRPRCRCGPAAARPAVPSVVGAARRCGRDTRASRTTARARRCVASCGDVAWHRVRRPAP